VSVMKTYKERTESILQKAEVQRQKKRKRITLISVLSSVAAVILAFNLVLFVPYTVGGTDLTKYSSSEYYGVIKQLYGLTHEITSPRQTNNFNEWFGGLFKAGAGEPFGGGPVLDGASGTTPSPPTSSAPEEGNSYHETTLNQTDGVTEGDLFKRSDTHIFYLGFTYGNYATNNGIATHELRIYTIAGEQSEAVTEYTIMPDNGMTFNIFTGSHEMYLSEDLTTITVISQCYEFSTDAVYTAVIGLDVSDLSHVKEKDRTYISGSYVSSRVAGDNLLVISRFTVKNNANFDNVSAYVPQVGKKENRKPLAANDIVCPKNADDPHYTVICSLDNELEVKDSVALLSFSDDVYVSQNNLFATRSYFNGDEYTSNATTMTDIRIVPYEDGTFGDTRAVIAEGSVVNRYSLDEYNGILRAVTTVRYIGGNLKSKCMLYCYDLNTLEVAAKVTNFAPAGESVKSARFYGDTAYVCTAKVDFSIITDPVFAFDLSDLNNITYTDTGTIPGYSLSLTGFTDNTLLGIGYGNDRWTLKIELYKQTDSNVVSVVKYEEELVTFSSEFKAHLIDAENGIIGLGIVSEMQGDTRYALFTYDGDNLIEIASVEMSTMNVNYMRATVIDGYVYIFEDDGYSTETYFHVIKIA
ncbi:MAG: beta-propeller domain-containing protein, partial [Clostridiales bacterium]|nr:beta-propeller domain-containing protein [Clostridiales bacterium]